MNGASSVVVVPYSESWPALFSGLREELLELFNELPIAVEHIGSTSVPGLAAKPVIDILLGARSLGDIESKVVPLSALGYAYVHKYEHEIPERRYFVRSPSTSTRVHLHGVVTGSSLWRNHVAFRDALRADASLRSDYQNLKIGLASRHADDKVAYTEGKGPFIRTVLARGNASVAETK